MTTITGMVDLAAEKGQGPFAGLVTQTEKQPNASGILKKVRKTAANIPVALVVLHLVGVAWASFAHRENLARAMITRRKRAEYPQEPAQPVDLDHGSGGKRLA